MKGLLINWLRILSRLTLSRYQPKIVAITGSVGKTSTKETVAAVLATKFSVRRSSGNYNNEIGVPLTILGFKSPGKNGLVWIGILVSAILKLIWTKYPQVLVLELGADRPGDIGYLVGMLGKIDVAILTDIGISHLEFFDSPAELAKEKLNLIRKLPKSSAAILNFDNQKIVDGKNQTKAEVVGYGFNPDAKFMISDFQIFQAKESLGVNFKIHNKGTVVPFFIPGTLGLPIVYAATAAAATGLEFGIHLVESSEALKNLVPPPGRLRLLAGIKNTRIIDDTYNSAPDSTYAALDALTSVARNRKIVVLGEMAELGTKSESGHREVGARIAESQIDAVFLVGAKTKSIASEMKKKNFTGEIFSYTKSDDARIPVQDFLQEGDTILVKGSQSARMEKIVKEIMADPEKAGELLVRQDGKWQSLA